MNNTLIESLNNELKRLENFSEIIGTAIVDRNGLLISSRLPRDIDDRKFGALAATMFGSIDTAVSTFENPNINHLTVEYNDYQLIVMGISDKLIIVSLMESNINLGLILIELEEVQKKIIRY